eukprot:GHUV01007973.1.p4 GENE.GHUV01007973.1~~GHUV01007973.1.p4  ORF type:complete len:104 (+),score=39.71 GHUV01007973.1:275-586(+)
MTAVCHTAVPASRAASHTQQQGSGKAMHTAVHQEAPEFTKQSTEQEIWATTSKVRQQQLHRCFRDLAARTERSCMHWYKPISVLRVQQQQRQTSYCRAQIKII